MIIQSVALRVPSKCITNEQITQLIQEQNSDCSPEQLSLYSEKIGMLLEGIGAKTRFIRDKAAGECGFDLIMDAVRSAISEANITAREIDLIIYCGVGRGFLEPANGAFIANSLQVSCEAFDVSEACMSWVRSIQIAYNFFATGAYSRIVVVNAEFTVHENGFPTIFRMRPEGQLIYTFPALTIGEAVTATVLGPSTQKWIFQFRSAPALAALCNVPLPGYEDFSPSDARIGLNGVHRLVSFGPELSRAAIRAMIKFIQESGQDLDKVDLWIPHSTAEPVFRRVARKLGVEHKFYLNVFSNYGNIISASIPAAVALAISEGRLKRGDELMLCPATAGMSFGLIRCQF